MKSINFGVIIDKIYFEKKLMNLKVILGIVFLLFCRVTLFAQIETPTTSIQFEVVEDDYKVPEGYELPALKIPSLTTPKDPFKPESYSDLGLDKPESLDITSKEDFIDLKTDTAPKYFTKDKKILEEYGKDQHLGDYTTNTGSVTIMYRDHEFVDGDRIRIYVNGDIVKSSVYLSSGFDGFTFPLQSGFNRVVFQALNQGSSGPNTAELQIYDEAGIIIAHNQWNLTTGRKASVMIIKEE